MKSFRTFIKVEGLNHDRYMRSHGKKAKGTGKWAFTTKRMGDVDMGNDKEFWTSGPNQSLSKAAKDAQKALHTKDVYVMEKLGKDSTMGDYIDDFKKSDAPQFKGRSKEKRKQMAIAAKLSADEK